MKYVILVSIVLLFGWFGYLKKQKYVMRKNIIQNIKEYINFYDSNLSVLKTDLEKINQDYLIMQELKSANKYNFLIKNNYIFNFDYIILKNNLESTGHYLLIENYLKSLGSADCEYEKKKNLEMKTTLNSILESCDYDIKNKGELYFKVMLAMGVVIAILIW